MPPFFYFVVYAPSFATTAKLVRAAQRNENLTVELQNVNNVNKQMTKPAKPVMTTNLEHAEA